MSPHARCSWLVCYDPEARGSCTRGGWDWWFENSFTDDDRAWLTAQCELAGRPVPPSALGWVRMEARR